MPIRFARVLIGHEVDHCSRLGWERLSNGNLLSAAEEAGFAVLVTVDKGIQFQQHLPSRRIGVIYLSARQNDLGTLGPMGELVLAALSDVKPGTLLTIRHPNGF